MYYGICASSECKNQNITEFYSGLPLKTRSQTPVPGSPFLLLVTSSLKMRWSKKYSSDCVAVNFFFPVFIFSMPSKVIVIVIQLMFLGINIFRGLLRGHFNPHLTARAKMSLIRGHNSFMSAKINSIVLLTHQ